MLLLQRLLPQPVVLLDVCARGAEEVSDADQVPRV